MRFYLVKTKCPDLYTTMTSQPSSEKRHNCRLGGFNDPKIVVGGRGAYALACAPLVIHKSSPSTKKRNIINHLPTTDRASLMAPLPNLSATSHAFMRPLKNAIANRNKYKEEQQHARGSAEHTSPVNVNTQDYVDTDVHHHHVDSDTIADSPTNAQVAKIKTNSHQHSNVVVPDHQATANNSKAIANILQRVRQHTRQVGINTHQASINTRQAGVHTRQADAFLRTRNRLGEDVFANIRRRNHQTVVDNHQTVDHHSTIKDDIGTVGNNKGFFIQVEHSMN